MALPIVIAKNQTASPIPLPRLGMDVPASPATLTLTDFYSFYEISWESALFANVENGNIVINDGTSDLAPAVGIAYLDATGNFNGPTSGIVADGLIRMSGTTGRYGNSTGITVDNSDNLSRANSIGFKKGSFDLIVQEGDASLTGNRTLSLKTNNADRVIDLGGDIQVSGGNVTLTGPANVSLPSSGTLISTATNATGDLSGTFGTPKVASASETFALSGQATPTLSAGTYNDYAITSISTLRVQGSGGNITFTGFAGGAAGRLLIVQNFHPSNLVTLKSNDTGSLAPNRLSYRSGIDVILRENDFALLQYESTGFATIWRVLFVSSLTVTNPTQGDILYFTGTNWVGLPAGTSGQLLQTNGPGANPSWVTVSSTPSGTGTATLNFGATPGTNVVEVVVTGQASIASGATVEAFLMADSTATHNAYEHSVIPMKLTCGDVVAGVGFTILAVTDWRVDGTFTCRWSWKN